VTDEDNPGKPWNFNIEWQRLAANITVVRVAGDLRGDGAASLRRTLAGELTGTPELLVLDLSNIVEIDADGVDALHSVAELADEDDIRLCLVVLPKGAVRPCLKVVELTKTFQTFSSVTEALQHPRDRPTQRFLPAIAKHLAILCGELTHRENPPAPQRLSSS
jgi:anti-anti-sigma regulatory factor